MNENAVLTRKSAGRRRLLAGAGMALLFIALLVLCGRQLYQMGILRDEQGISGPVPFYAMYGLWVAALACVAAGLYGAGMLFFRPVRKPFTKGALAAILLPCGAAAVFIITILVLNVGYAASYGYS